MKRKTNLESKYFCGDFKPIRKALRSIGARKESIKYQKDYFFNLPGSKNKKIPARLKLRISNKKQTLVFYRRPDFSTKNATPADIVLFPVKDRGMLSFLLKALGMKVIVKKQRELWRKGSAVFHLDKVQGVGNVFEIEIWTKPKTIKKDRRNFEEYKKELLPYLDKIIKGSNEDLLLKLKIIKPERQANLKNRQPGGFLLG